MNEPNSAKNDPFGKLDIPSTFFDDVQRFQSITAMCQSEAMRLQRLYDETGILDTLKKAQETFEPIIASIRAYEDMIGRFVNEEKRLEEYKKRLHNQQEHEKQAFHDSGWWLSPTLAEQDVRIIDKAVKKYAAGTRGAMDDLFIDVFERGDQKNMSSMVQSWGANVYFEEWMPIIVAAQRAHVDKQYSLSIPAFLLVIEGVARNIGRAIQSYEHTEMKSSAHASLSTLMKAAAQEMPDLALSVDYFLEALDNFLYKTVNKGNTIDVQPIILNRHSIMHGYSATYGTLTNSLRCFMVLDVLSLIKKA